MAATCAIWLSASATAAPAFAQPANTEQARELFEAGAQAYEQGKYPFAIQAFQQAYALTPRDGLLFSIAQAYRRQYAIDGQVESLTQAVAYYEKYLTQAPNGKRRGEVAAALADLKPMLEKAEQSGEGIASPKATTTSLSIDSPVRGATVRVDGGEEQELPHFMEVAPGKHTLLVRAPGYFEEQREVLVVEGALYPASVPLREKPGALLLQGPDGADVSVDGRFVGSTPLSSSIEIQPGSRFVTLTMNGHEPYAEDVEFERGEPTRLTVDLDATTQRTVSWILMGTGAVAVTTGLVIGGFALTEQQDAQDILQKGTNEPLTNADRDEYEASRADRDNLRRLALITMGTGVGIGLVGGALFLFDRPTVTRPAAPGDGGSGGATDSTDGNGTDEPGADDFEMSAVPSVHPEMLGLTVQGTF